MFGNDLDSKKDKDDNAMKIFSALMLMAMSIEFAVIYYSSALANSVEYVEAITIPLNEKFETKEKWFATVYEVKNVSEWIDLYNQGKTSDLSDRPIRLCFWNGPRNMEENCFSAINNTLHEPAYSFQHIKKLEIIKLQDNKEPYYGILLEAENKGYKLGEAYRGLTYISVWAYSKTMSKFVKITPAIYYTDQGEFQIIPSLDTQEGVAVKADFIWGNNETRYSPHQYKICIYKLDNNGEYRLIDGYITRNKYLSFDDTDKIDLVNHEINCVLGLINNNKN